MQLEEAVQATNNLMFAAVKSDVQVLEDASRHIITAGGKRVRPQLLFLSYEAVGGRNLAEVVPLAAAVELVHTATLVHDDINDHGRLRRGRATVNERWGRTFALLTGDFLFTQVYSLMSPYGDLNKILAEATVALVEGETLQAAAAKEDNLNRELYQRIVAKKTASLFRASAMLGATYAAGPQKTAEALGDFGFFLGLTFQVVDDLLDLTGDPRVTGKEVGIDIAQGRGVAMAIAHEGKGHNGKTPTVAIDEELAPSDNFDDDPFLHIKRRLIAGGAVEEGTQMSKFLAAQARAALSQVPANEATSELEGLVDLVLNRHN